MEKPPAVPTNTELYQQINELDFQLKRLQMEVEYLKGEQEKLKRANLGR